MPHETRSICRICVGSCGVRIALDARGQITRIRADRDHPMTAGHACFKGLQSGATHNSPNRLLKSKKRVADGSFVDIGFDDALDEIAEQLLVIRDRHGPDAIATYMGGPAFYNMSLPPMAASFMTALGTRNRYSSLTIDQPGKLLNPERLGYWQAGKVLLDDSDVVLVIGANPMVSSQLHGFVTVDPVKRLKRARARGVKLIVVDPRRTETAAFADVHLQLRPGEDVTLAAGFIRAILDLGLEDREFCDRHIRSGHMERLRTALEPFTPDYVERRAGVPAALLLGAVALFARQGARGSAYSGTGPAMGAHGTLAEHLIEVINVVTGGFRRAGDRIADVLPLAPDREVRAQAVSPARSWEALPPTRFGGMPALFGERLTCNLADEITTPGPGQIRAMINDSGNIASAVPDQRKVVNALSQLDLLVSVEPFMTTTARLSHYVIAPKLQYERADLPGFFPGLSATPLSWTQYVASVASPPEGAEAVDEWRVFFGLSKRMGLPINYAGVTLDPTFEPDTDTLLAHVARFGVVPLDEIKMAGDGGRIFDLERYVAPAEADAGAFEPAPGDIVAELREVVTEWSDELARTADGRPLTYRFAVRRHRDMMNAQGLYTDEIRERARYNSANLHPEDLTVLGLRDGDRVLIVSRRDQVPAIVKADETLQRGVVTMSHGWGGLPEDGDDYLLAGANTNRLIDGDADRDRMSAMARMTGFPVAIEPARSEWPANS